MNGCLKNCLCNLNHIAIENEAIDLLFYVYMYIYGIKYREWIREYNFCTSI